MDRNFEGPPRHHPPPKDRRADVDDDGDDDESYEGEYLDDDKWRKACHLLQNIEVDDTLAMAEFHFDEIDFDLEDVFEDIIAEMIQHGHASNTVFSLEDQHDCYRVDYMRAKKAGNAPAICRDGEGAQVFDERCTFAFTTKCWLGGGKETPRLVLTYYGNKLDELLRANPPEVMKTWDCVEQTGPRSGNDTWHAAESG